MGQNPGRHNSCFDKETKRAVRPYVFPILLFYDTGVYRIWNPYIWECPSSYLEDNRYVSNIHLEAALFAASDRKIDPLFAVRSGPLL